MTKPKHGGKRLNAGRKTLAVPKKPLHVMLEPHDREHLNQICRREHTSQAKRITAWIREHRTTKK